MLCSIPGVGSRTAILFLAEVGDLRLFRSARQLAAYLGLNPRHWQSGTSVHRRSRMSKVGNALLRTALFFPAIVAKQHNPVIRTFCQRLTERGLVPMAVVGAAMRKLVHIMYGVVKGGQPFDPQYVCPGDRMAMGA